MRLTAIALAAALVLAVAPARAAPKVATDIAPVQSLVARVMQGIATPAVILPPGVSPHGYAMRPSEAAALAEADVVIWIGETLTPGLGRAVRALAADAVSVELLDAPGTTLLPVREDATFGQDPEAHGHGASDPHAWLDPENAQAWLGTIAAALAEADPANAAAYARNAAAGRAEIEALTAGISDTLAPVRDRPFIVFHDAYHYFTTRFGLAAEGAISPGDASGPGPARVAAIREVVRRTGAACVFAEPQFAPALIDTVTEGTGARAATLDPLGAALAPGPGLYATLMRDLAGRIAGCLGAGA